MEKKENWEGMNHIHRACTLLQWHQIQQKNPQRRVRAAKGWRKGSKSKDLKKRFKARIQSKEPRRDPKSGFGRRMLGGAGNNMRRIGQIGRNKGREAEGSQAHGGQSDTWRTGRRTEARQYRRGFKKSRYLLLLLLPGLAWYLVFCYLPMYGALIAFKDYTPEYGKSFLESVFSGGWVGLEQFRRFFGSYNFGTLLRNTVLLSVYNLLFGFPLPIVFALVLNEIRGKHFRKFAQTVSYLPHFISTVAIVSMMTLFLSPRSGFVNRILMDVFHREPIYFMSEPGWFRFLYVCSGIWQDLGWGAIVYLAALSNVDQEMYEAATVDGAGRFQKMIYISLPALKSTILMLLILNIGSMFSIGGEKVILMYQPSTYETADVISSFVYRRGLQYAEFSYTTAVGLFNSLINLILLVTANWLSGKLAKEKLF